MSEYDKDFWDGYTCTDCILDGTDACVRGAGRAVDDEICDFFLREGEEE